MGTIKLEGTAGSVTLATNNPTSNYSVELPNTNGRLATMQLATAQTASGTSVDFTDIPSWAKRITVMFSGVSANGTSILQIQLGTSGGVEASGYLGIITQFQGAFTGANTNLTNGFLLSTSAVATDVEHGAIYINNISSNTWCANGSIGRSNTTNSSLLSGSKVLSGTLDRIRITTVNGTDTFDAGTINIMYEG